MPFTLIHQDNSLIKDKVSRLRDARTESEEYVRLIQDLSTALAFHVGSSLPLELRDVSTPRCPSTRQPFISDQAKTFVFSLFRAALPMAEKLKNLIPNVAVVHVVYKDKQLLDVRDLPPDPSTVLKGRRIIIADPIIGTGGSMLKLITFLLANGCQEDGIQIVCIAASRDGIRALAASHPTVMITALVEEERLLADGYLDPGFGDVGDRVFGL